MKNSNKTKIVNKRATDPFDILIFEKGIRAKDLLIYPELDLMVIVLNTGKTINAKISDYAPLKNANPQQLKKWKLTDSGIAFQWEELDEDLSLRGFIRKAAYDAALQNIAPDTIVDLS